MILVFFLHRPNNLFVYVSHSPLIVMENIVVYRFLSNHMWKSCEVKSQLSQTIPLSYLFSARLSVDTPLVHADLAIYYYKTKLFVKKPTFFTTINHLQPLRKVHDPRCT